MFMNVRPNNNQNTNKPMTTTRLGKQGGASSSSHPACPISALRELYYCALMFCIRARITQLQD